MNILLVGGGGREHALAWKIKRSPEVRRLVVAPGNPGVEQLTEVAPVSAIDVDGLVALAREMKADLVVVGPEAALERGLADRLAAVGIPCFGPSAKAARLETSKAFTKRFAESHGLPTARYAVFEDAAAAKAGLDAFEPPYVIKADGLAAGKGVVISPDRKDAEAVIEHMLGGRMGEAGARVVIEEFMTGEEASLFALSDGRRSILFGGAQDHKRAYDGDTGPNTGGMGAYSPAPVLSAAVVERARREIFDRAIEAMAAEGSPYRGVLYAGLMVGDDGAPRLVEFNARFGDPECQVLMLRLKSDLVPYLHGAAAGDLSRLPEPEWREGAAVCVVMAAKGYPDSPLRGSVIRGLDQDFGAGVAVFHAGTGRSKKDGALVAAGGRVLNVCAVGRDVADARDRAYEAVGRIDWPGGFHRTDIAWRAIGRA